MQQPVTISEQMKAMKIINLALIGGVGMFSIVAFFVSEGEGLGIELNVPDFNLLTGLMAFAGVGFYLGNVLFNRKVDKTGNLSSLREKLEVYQKASIVRYALIEGPAFAGIVLFLIKGYLLFYVVPLLAMAVMFWLRPTPARLSEELSLSEEEMHQLNQA